MNFKIGDRIFVRGYVDEIRKDTVIVRNDGGYFGTIPSEVTPSAQPEKRTEEHMETHTCDLIDRQAAVDAIYHHLPSVSRTRARTMLHEVPSAQPERKWIPCSERLPEKDGRYQVTRYDYVANTEFIDILWYEENLWWNRHSTGDYAVTAWTPLPEPYKERREE